MPAARVSSVNDLVGTPPGPYTTDNTTIGNEKGPVAQVIVGRVSSIPVQGSYNLTGTRAQVWEDYLINSRYESDKHLYMMGITSPNGFQGQSAAFCQLAAPTLLWVVDWTAARWNVQPDIPDPNPSPGLGSQWVLLDQHLEPAMLVPASDGISVLYRISGTYVYGHRNPNSNVFNNINYTRPPWLLDIYDRTQPGATGNKLQQNLITSPQVP